MSQDTQYSETNKNTIHPHICCRCKELLLKQISKTHEQEKENDKQFLYYFYSNRELFFLCEQCHKKLRNQANKDNQNVKAILESFQQTDGFYIDKKNKIQNGEIYMNHNNQHFCSSVELSQQIHFCDYCIQAKDCLINFDNLFLEFCSSNLQFILYASKKYAKEQYKKDYEEYITCKQELENIQNNKELKNIQNNKELKNIQNNKELKVKTFLLKKRIEALYNKYHPIKDITMEDVKQIINQQQ